MDSYHTDAAPPRKIIHVDMDAFFASVEQRDNPSLRGQPVVVGGTPHGRGVVCAASYEARKFGIHSAMPCREAYQRCRHAIFVKPRFEAYRAVSDTIMEIFREYTDDVEALSLDEAYLDVTENKKGVPFATAVAKQIRERILFETGLTASAGVAPNKFLAKIASDMHKPNGLVVIPPEKVPLILEELPVRKLPGVGKVTEIKMHLAGILTTRDIRSCSRERLTKLFGKMGEWYMDISHGRDTRRVIPHRERKSVGVEDTFPEDILERELLEHHLESISEQVTKRLGTFKGLTLTLKLTYAGFVKVTRSKTAQKALTGGDIRTLSKHLLAQTEAGSRPIRLLGISISNFLHLREGVSNDSSDGMQLRLAL